MKVPKLAIVGLSICLAMMAISPVEAKKPGSGSESGFVVVLDGTGELKDGSNVTVNITGDLGGENTTKGDNVTRYSVSGTLNIKITNETGVVLVDKDIQVKGKAWKAGGAWKWDLSSGRAGGWSAPKITLKGSSSEPAASLLELTGGGTVSYKLAPNSANEVARATLTGSMTYP